MRNEPPELPLPAVVLLVNEWGSEPRREAGEQDWPFPARRQLLALVESAPSGWRRLPTAQLQEAADALHPVFAAGSPVERAALLSDLAESRGLVPRIGVRDGEIVLSLVAPETSAPATLLAAAVTTLVRQLSEGGRTGLGVCEGTHCVDAWADASRGRPRRYCSDLCAGRARVAAHRRRQRAAVR